MLIASGDPALTLLPVSLEPMSHTVGVTRPSERPLSPSALALLEHLDAVAAEMSSTVA
jgi:hypothetical protein